MGVVHLGHAKVFVHPGAVSRYQPDILYRLWRV